MEYLYLFLIVIALFHTVSICGYCVDDNVQVQTWNARKKYFKENGFRESIKRFTIPQLIHQLCYGAGIFKNAFQEHVFTTFLHYVNCCLLYKITGSFMATVLYLINPVNNQIAVWLNGRRYAVGILCVLLIWIWKPLFFILYPFAVWVHVYAVGLPVLMLFTEYWWTVPIVLIFARIFAWEKLKAKYLRRKQDFHVGNELHVVRPKKIIIYIKSLGYNFFHTIFPNKPRMYHEFLYYFSRYPEEIKRGYSLNFEFWKGLAVVAFIGYEIIIEHNLWALWWLVFISQWCNIRTVTQNASDRYCTLAGIGLMVTLNDYIRMLPDPYMQIAYTFFITFYVLRYLPLFRAYRSVLDFHLYHINIQPDAVESRTLLASNVLAKDPFTSFSIIKQGLRYRPHDFKLLIVMSQALFALRKAKAGLSVLDLAEKQVPLGDEEDCKREFTKIREDFKQVQEKADDKKLNRKQRREKKKFKK